MEKIIIVGAGLVGAALSAHLAQLGFHVQLVDPRPDPRSVEIRSNRSLTIVVSKRGFRSLEKIGADGVVRAHSLPIYGRTMHAIDGTLAYQPYGPSGEALQAIGRADFNRVLVEHADNNEQVVFHFNEKCIDVDLDTATVTLEHGQTKKIRTLRGDRVIGADGAHSLVRRTMQKRPFFNFSQHYLDQVYKEIVLPAGKNGQWQLENNRFHVWPRSRFMLSGFPNLDGSFGLSLHLPRIGKDSPDEIKTSVELRAFFAKNFADVLPLLGNRLDAYFERPLGSLVTVKAFPWSHGDKAAIIGDAAHAITPYYGQGANAGLEDCQVLVECLLAHEGDWQAAFRDYEQQRQPNTDTIADLSYAHFLELHRHVADDSFLLRKKIERRIQFLEPERAAASLYHNISFEGLPYLEALKIDKKNQRVIDRLMAVEQIEQLLDRDRADGLIRGFLESADTTR